MAQGSSSNVSVRAAVRRAPSERYLVRSLRRKKDTMAPSELRVATQPFDSHEKPFSPAG